MLRCAACSRAARGVPQQQLRRASALPDLDSYRRRGERLDAVNDEVLRARAVHALRMDQAHASRDTLKKIDRLRLGRVKGWHNQKAPTQRQKDMARARKSEPVEIGHITAGCASPSDIAAVNREGLTEIAMFGHSNCGKSALLNALAAKPALQGPAKVHARPGWTARLHFYHVRNVAEVPAELQLSMVEGSSAKGLVCVDTPGYGHTVADRAERAHWRALVDDYVSHSRHLSLAVVLIDSQRGVCAADGHLLARLHGARVPVLPVLTKADLLRRDALAQSHAVVQAQLRTIRDGIDDVRELRDEGEVRSREVELAMVSSHFFMGVRELWCAIGAMLARGRRRIGNEPK